MTERPEGTKIVGRFNPDPLVTGAGFLAMVMFALSVAAVLTVGVSGLLRICAYWFGTANGLASSALALAVLASGVIRSLGWNRQCQMISSVVEETCCAAPIDPSSV